MLSRLNSTETIEQIRMSHGGRLLPQPYTEKRKPVSSNEPIGVHFCVSDGVRRGAKKIKIFEKVFAGHRLKKS